MTRMVQVAVAGDVTEAEELESILQAAGIETQLEPAVEHHPTATEDGARAGGVARGGDRCDRVAQRARRARLRRVVDGNRAPLSR
jgi:hypothetical protein